MVIGATRSGNEPQARPALAVEFADFTPDVIANVRLRLIETTS